jgi:hypothetical protein
MRGIFSSVVIGTFLVVGSIVAATDAKLAEKQPPKDIDESIRGVLSPKAIVVSDGDKPKFEFWLRKELPLQSKPESPAKALD